MLLEKSPRPQKKLRRKNNQFRAIEPPGGCRHIVAQVICRLSLSPSSIRQEMQSLTAIIFARSLNLDGSRTQEANKKPRRFIVPVRSREPTKTSCFFSNQLTCLSKRFLRHSFHRKEFRRKGELVETCNFLFFTFLDFNASPCQHEWRKD